MRKHKAKTRPCISLHFPTMATKNPPTWSQGQAKICHSEELQEKTLSLYSRKRLGNGLKFLHFFSRAEEDKDEDEEDEEKFQVFNDGLVDPEAGKATKTRPIHLKAQRHGR
ncbi:hypothetical protein B0H19DRAFT_495236 [Mycena capillaripes]|nr:hypothetical protein B0H19DRAFT_495236 [Mycena capillaripes]